MCGRYRNHLAFNDMLRLADRTNRIVNARANPDIRPTTQQFVVRGAPGDRELAQMRWGLVPYWHGGKALKDFKLTTFNAKAEGVATASTFKGAFARRRCLVIADGWYEWTGPKGSKERWLFTAKGGEALTFGGCWDASKTSDAGDIESFTIITQPAGAPLNGYHDRAPVVIWPEDRERWMTAGADVADLIGPESVDRFHITPVSKAEEASWKVET